MKSVMLRIHPNLGSDAISALLDRLKMVDGVVTVAPLKPGAKNAAVARLFYLVLDDSADAQHVAERVLTMPEIESAGLPAAREQIDPPWLRPN